MSSYQELTRRFEQFAVLGEVRGQLGWDMETMMPDGGAESRADQLAVVSEMAHGIVAAPDMQELLERADEEALAPAEVANLREMRRVWTHETAADADLVKALAREGTSCMMTWREARKSDDFSLLRPKLETVLELSRELASRLSERLGVEPYDAMIDRFEPGMRAKNVDQIFAPLVEQLPGLIDEVLERQGPKPELGGPYDTSAQERVARRLMDELGFDFNHGRLDRSHHPFCGGVPEDVRITTRYDVDDPVSAMMGVVHETGHALYERNLPGQWRRQPVGTARSMGVHESQSLFVEMQLGCSRAFLERMAPMLGAEFGSEDPVARPETLVAHVQRVERGLIRVDADEVTYPMHVVLRFRLEKGLFDGSISVADLPEAWRSEMKGLLGIVPPSDAVGCMQDIHWMDGSFGYFPSYTLGALLAAQLREAADLELGGVDALVRDGRVGEVIAWLTKNVHSRASIDLTDELIIGATGESLSASAFLRHVRSRYLAS